MEFLYKLYSNNYFGIGLFIVITVLAFAFLIILFFGKKDEKARIEKEKALEEEKKMEVKEETPEVEGAVLEPITLNEEVLSKETIPEEVKQIPIEPPISDGLETFDEKPLEEDPYVTSNIILNTDYIAEEPPKEERKEEPRTSDIYNLNSIINEEPITVTEEPEETIDDVLNKYDAIEETMIKTQSNSVDMGETRVENIPVVEENEVNVFDRPGENLKKASTPFSSVYLTKEEAETKTEESVEQPTPITPSPLSRSNFEMPKRMDLPKRSANAINESIISSMSAERNTNPFDHIEEDSYNIGKE